MNTMKLMQVIRGYGCLALIQIRSLGYVKGSDKTSDVRCATHPSLGAPLTGKADAGVTDLSAFPCTGGANPHLL